jgi:F-type H+-transporting ATPase subunit b
VNLALALQAATGPVGSKSNPFDCQAVGAHCLNAVSKNPILPSVPEIVWGTLAFVVLLVVLSKYALPPVQKALKDRSDRIAGDLAAADDAKAEAQRTLEEYKQELAQARSESNRIIEEARQAAEGVRKDLVARAEAEAADLRARNDEALRQAQDRVLAEVEGRVREVALDLAEKVVGANLDRDRNLALIDQYIAELNAPA